MPLEHCLSRSHELAITLHPTRRTEVVTSLLHTNSNVHRLYSPVALPRETLAACGAPQTLDRVYPEQPRVTSPSPTGGPHAAPRNIQHVVIDEWPGKSATLRNSQVYLQHVNSYTSWDPRASVRGFVAAFNSFSSNNYENHNKTP